jgi:beta-hydroxylase
LFFATSNFPFVVQLERNWRAIAAELAAIRSQPFLPWPETFLYEGSWNVFGLYGFGRKLPGNCTLCPQTAQLVEAIPGMTTAGFSLLAAGTVIRPHVGYSHEVLRCHLGLITPPGCALRVGTETRTWQEGKCLIFDDTVEHEAWNKGLDDRTVLLIDFKRPLP